jgi:hypothetical protein
MTNALSSYEWFLRNDFSRYSGKWIALIDKSVVASGEDAAGVLKEVNRKYPGKRPFLTKIRSKLSIL